MAEVAYDVNSGVGGLVGPLPVSGVHRRSWGILARLFGQFCPDWLVGRTGCVRNHDSGSIRIP